MNDMRVVKNDFAGLVRLFGEVKILDNIMNDMFLTYARKLGQAAPVDLHRAQTVNPTVDKLESSQGSLLGRSLNSKGVSKGLGVSPAGHLRQASFVGDEMDDDGPAEITKCDLAVVDSMFDKFWRTEESLSGFLNVKMIKQKFADFRQKLEVWKNRDRARKRNKRNFKKYTKNLLAAFKKAKTDFTMDNDEITQIGDEFIEF